MLQYKKVKIPKKNLPNEIDSKEFKKVWINSLSDQNSDLDCFIRLIEPFVLRTEKELKSMHPHTYFLNTLLRYIDSDPQVSLKKLKAWVKKSDVKSELYFIIIERLRNLKKIPYKARPLMAEYYFVLDFKYALSKQIKKTKLNKKIILPEFVISQAPEINYDTGNKWYNYIIMLYMSGYTVTEISNLTKLSRKTILKEGEKIWQCLKQKQ